MLQADESLALNQVRSEGRARGKVVGAAVVCVSSSDSIGRHIEHTVRMALQEWASDVPRSAFFRRWPNTAVLTGIRKGIDG